MNDSDHDRTVVGEHIGIVGIAGAGLDNHSGVNILSQLIGDEDMVEVAGPGGV